MFNRSPFIIRAATTGGSIFAKTFFTCNRSPAETNEVDAVLESVSGLYSVARIAKAFVAIFTFGKYLDGKYPDCKAFVTTCSISQSSSTHTFLVGGSVIVGPGINISPSNVRFIQLFPE